jgi:hypothetical protein
MVFRSFYIKPVAFSTCSALLKRKSIMGYSSLPLSSPELEETNLVSKGIERFYAVFIEVIINPYASPVFFPSH